MAFPSHDWYAAEWLRYYGKKQADVARELDWNKAKVSLTLSGKQPYARDDVNELAAYLNLEPFELLLPPDRAMAFRQVLAEGAKAARLAHENEPIDIWDEKLRRDGKPGKRRTGTDG